MHGCGLLRPAAAQTARSGRSDGPRRGIDAILAQVRHECLIGYRIVARALECFCRRRRRRSDAGKALAASLRAPQPQEPRRLNDSAARRDGSPMGEQRHGVRGLPSAVARRARCQGHVLAGASRLGVESPRAQPTSLPDCDPGSWPTASPCPLARPWIDLHPGRDRRGRGPLWRAAPTFRTPRSSAPRASQASVSPRLDLFLYVSHAVGVASRGCLVAEDRPNGVFDSPAADAARPPCVPR